MQKLALGTVQQGQDYGITDGKMLLVEDSIELYKTAYDNGINCLDTAAQYGQAEIVIGCFFAKYPELKSKFKITSKLRPHSLDDYNPECSYDIILKEFETSLNNMGLEELDGYLFHNPSHMFNEYIMDNMYKLKKSGKVKNIGVSVYTVDEALFASDSAHIDYIQIPYNVLDQRLDSTGFFDRAKKNGKILFARSTFLQGLLLMPLDEVDKKLPVARPYIDIFRDIVGGIPLYEACLAFNKSRSNIDYLVLGVSGKQDLLLNIATYYSKNDYSEYISQAEEMFKFVPDNIIMPNMWHI